MKYLLLFIREFKNRIEHVTLAMILSIILLPTVGFSQPVSAPLEKIDSIVMQAIQQRAFPGCVIYASLGDSVIFQKAYGHHTYDSINTVDESDLYDLASLTKIMGGTMAIMLLYDEGLIHLDDPIGKYIGKLGKIGKVSFREVLAHQAGLYPWIPFYTEIRKKNGRYKRKTLSKRSNNAYQFQISEGLYLHNDFYEKIKKMIRKSDMGPKEYRYSGLFYYLIPELVRNLTNMNYEDYLWQKCYGKIGTSSIGFNPLKNYSPDQIVPTEVDTFFRMQTLHGVVHDEGAIFMKGLSGNAGLFGNAEDVGKVCQLFLNSGHYDTLQLIEPHTLQLFTTTQYPNNANRRGLGFDKPLLTYDSLISSIPAEASHSSYGHTGFTGTLAWIDPEVDLVFVFLSNRVYPSRNNKKIYELNVRPTIHKLFYEMLAD
jgi:CubicO group peptidase (beta-lactamase class C family)